MLRSRYMGYRTMTSTKMLCTAYTMSVSALSILACWIFLDPHIQFVFSSGWYLVYQRLLLFIALSVLAAASTAFVSLRLVFGSTRGRSLKSHILALLLVAMWLGLWCSSDDIAWTGVMWRIKRIMPRLKADAHILVEAWPTESGTLPYSGDFDLEEWGWDRRLVLTKWHREPLPRIAIGRTIEREQGKWIVFSLDVLSQIVYQPVEGFATDPTVPESKVHAWSPDRKIIEIEPEWFFVTSVYDWPCPPTSVATSEWSRKSQRFVSTELERVRAEASARQNSDDPKRRQQPVQR